ncbi:MAG: hypothetical protein HOL15_10075 [Nitrospinaceae bacterium]|nr:hypothetical protein [Nitrospina sp.]MBT5377148.1 hypothetical protein [Nitrospinaceae bacterium]MBT5868543.1 hypothetical protein [Nitrospinaceae bacterium]MBT6346847.1 hypothetical protein [Nitrospina sp.]
MKLNDQEVNWKEIALLLNGANDELTKTIYNLDQEYTTLQAQHQQLQELMSSLNKGLDNNN